MFIVLTQKIAEICWELRNEFGVLIYNPFGNSSSHKWYILQATYFLRRFFLYSMCFSYVGSSDEHLFQRIYIIYYIYAICPCMCRRVYFHPISFSSLIFNLTNSLPFFLLVYFTISTLIHYTSNGHVYI